MAREVFAVNHTLTGGRSFANQDVITYKIDYPEFVSYTAMESLERMNTYYRDSALTLARDFQTTYEADALADYYDHRAQGIPFNGYELKRPYTITYGEDCVVSLYLDEYIYTGGAHGTTVRTSDTWDARTGQRLPLSAMFPRGFNYAELLEGLIAEDIAKRNAAQPGLYFDDYAQRVAQTFNEASYYLTPDALTVYFQQYDIAPFSTGIPTFSYPYGLIGATVPKC